MQGGQTEWPGHDATQVRALFLLSFRQRDELSLVLSRAGWRVVAARRADGVRQRAQASGAAIVIVDARGAIEEGIAATAELAPPHGPGDAVIVLVSRNDVGRLSAIHDAGATHFLVSPVPEEILLQTLRFAQKHLMRTGGGWHERTAGGGAPLGWRYDGTRRMVQLTPALSEAIGTGDLLGRREALTLLDGDGRRAAGAAIRRLNGAVPATAFAHDLPGLGRVVQHIARDTHSGRLHGLVEPLAAVGDIGAFVRDALGSVRDAIGAVAWVDRRLRAGEAPAVLLISAGGIDPVNRVQGRSVGDGLLRAVERRVERAVRNIGVERAAVARMGGTEFAVLMPSRERLDDAAAAVVRAMGRPFVAGDTMVALTLRHAAVAAEAGDDADGLIRRVQAALPGVRSGDVARPVVDADAQRLAADIAKAIAGDQVTILFQPQVELTSNHIVGVEALARWQHPREGLLGADLLFEAADRAGLSAQLSAHVQQQALREAAGWPSALRRLRLSINVTAQDVAQPDFADVLLGRADDSGFPRGRLTVEITESGLIAELGEAARLLATLRAAGCRVAIDDFGTGYSSLAYLKALPLDYLKIDKKLAQDIVGSPRDRVVVRGVIDMARSLGLTVIAEGVENDAQRDALAADGCELYQGYLCSEPVGVDALVALVS